MVKKVLIIHLQSYVYQSNSQLDKNYSICVQQVPSG
jgi:hypothetical protein